MLLRFVLLIAAAGFWTAPSYAAKQTFVIQNGKMVQGGAQPAAPGAPAAAPSGQIQIDSQQKLMLEASGYMVRRDYRSAEALYSQVISMNPGHIEAYLQRGLARREMQDGQGSAADGRQAVLLANAALSRSPKDADLYYRRSMGFRLLKQFDYARSDMEAAIRLSGKKAWRTDLQAIALEAKMAQ